MYGWMGSDEEQQQQNLPYLRQVTHANIYRNKRTSQLLRNPPMADHVKFRFASSCRLETTQGVKHKQCDEAL